MTALFDSSQNFEALVLTAPGCGDPALAIAASRAGSLGVLNGEVGSADPSEFEAALARLRRFAGDRHGVKLAPGDGGQLERVLSTGPAPALLVLDAETVRAHGDRLASVRRAGTRVMVEITSWSRSLAGIEDHIDGWWLKGHEAGGWVGEQTSFVLLQDVAPKVRRPIYVRGGVNLHSIAACRVGGASGVVLDDQLLLVRESPLADTMAPRLKFFSGIESVLLDGQDGGRHLRVWSPFGGNTARMLQDQVSRGQTLTAHYGHPAAVGAANGSPSIAFLGQDGAMARDWAERFGSVAKALDAVYRAADDWPLRDDVELVLGEAAPLARYHGTRYPIVQGPMTHVSDRPAFVQAVAEAGALPMLAVSLMRGEKVHEVVAETKRRLGDRSWGVGLLGFIPTDIFDDQRRAIVAHRPPFAIIAGGRPDQARDLEAVGVRTYLHVPSPVLLRQFLEQDATHYIFEGRECGGHIGPLGSFALWGQMVDALLAEDSAIRDVERLHVLFAGGIHDQVSAAMAAAIAAPLARRGVRTGILMGTGYVFTEEAVATGAITPEFQRVAVRASRTVGLATGPGHISRCAATPFAKHFWSERRRLESEGRDRDQIRETLEALTLGRLRVASKGLARARADSSELAPVDLAEQRSGGMFMMGQAATLRRRPTTLADLHKSVAADALARFPSRHPPAARESVPANSADIAVIGVGAIYPGAPDSRTYWDNILDKVSTIREVPPDRWDWRLYYDQDRQARDRIYSKWGGFIDEVRFDPTRYGLPPRSLESLDPLQLLTLAAVQEALDDAGYAHPSAGDREQTSVILGFSGGLGDFGTRYAARSELLRIFGHMDVPATANLPKWTEDSFAGALPNVAAGRVANRFDFGGTNCTVDAACASSLAALAYAGHELESGRSRMVVCGGIDTVEGPFAFLCFSSSQALSPTGRCRTFDQSADGIAISEGLGIVVLKRLADAERDGDRIYAVIKGIGSSSDGRAKGLTAPSPPGQMRALRRAYAQARFAPSTVGLFEAHGTGTVAGDRAELESLTALLKEHGTPPGQCAVGSVKSLIGHTKAAAGVAGLIKVALALHYRVLPPHAGVEAPNPAFDDADCPLHLSQEPRPWVRPADHPRRAAVSAFGFGGTNFHAVLEEYGGEYRSWAETAPRDRWPAELFVFRGPDRDALAAAIGRVRDGLAAGGRPQLGALARAVALDAAASGPAAAAVAASREELVERLGKLQSILASKRRPAALPAGLALAEEPLGADAGPCFLFSGQGAQYPHMLREAAVCFAELRRAVEAADAVLADEPEWRARGLPALSRIIYPPDAFSDADTARTRTQVTRTDVAQPALGAIEAGLLALMARLGVTPAMCGGHSYGEYAALYAAGAFSFDELIRVSAARGRFIADAAAGGDLGTMAAVAADADTVAALVADVPGVVLANRNGPQQTILSGSREAIAAVADKLAGEGLTVTPLAVSAAFHSPLVAPAQAPLADYIAKRQMQTPALPVYSNTTAEPYERDVEAIKMLLARHLNEPVRFQEMIEAMYRDGARAFVEIGPKSILADLARSVLDGRPHLSVALDGAGGLKGFLNGVAQMFVHGVPIRMDALFAGRRLGPEVDLDRLAAAGASKPLPSHVWLVNGSRAYRPKERGEPPAKAIPTVAVARDSGRPAVVTNGSGTTNQAPDGPPIATADVATTRKGTSPNRGHTSTTGGRTMTNTIGQRPLGPAPQDSAMAEYYKTMRQFLQTQERLMLAYLNSTQGLPFVGMADDSVPHWDAALPAPQPVSSNGAGAGVIEPPSESHSGTAGHAPALTHAEAAPAAAPQPAPAPVPSPEKANGQPPTGSNGHDPGGQVDIQGLLLQLFSDRTGYPLDMLELDADIEADLGIDSIKRVEILGVLRKQMPDGIAAPLSEQMETLTKAKSLRALVDVIAGAAGGAAQRPFEPAGKEVARDAPLSRHVIEAHPEPAAGARVAALQPGVYVITPDSSGVAEKLAERIEAAGVSAQVMPTRYLDSDDDQVGAWLAKLRNAEPIRAVIHLAPVDPRPVPEDADLDWWRTSMDRHVKLLHRVLRHAASDLRQGGHILSVSATGGKFCRDAAARADGARLFPGGAGTVGLIKCLSFEWPESTCKAVDLDPGEAPERLAEHVFDELTLAGGRREVGYPGGARTIFRTVPASVRPVAQVERVPGPDWVVLAVGGAKGITAETLCEIARAKATLVLVGRSPAPADEGPELAALDGADALRRHFIAQARAGGARPTPAAVERQVQDILKAREMRANMRDFAAAGATVAYRTADMRDETQVRALLNDIYDRHGRIDAVLFGAGVLDDRRLADKSPESFARVFDAKVDGAFLLCRYLRPESLKFVAFFTSVAGRYGNPGQTDYGAANEVLNRYAWVLHAAWGGRVKVAAINWGAWTGTTNGPGMVTAETRRQFEARGVKLIEPAAGRRFVLNELLYAPADEVEVVAGDHPWEYREAEHGALDLPRKGTVELVTGFPLLSGATVTSRNGGGRSLVKTIDLVSDPYLDHHRLDGTPVMPFVCAIEYMAEAAAALGDGGTVVEVTDIRRFHGVVLHHGRATVEVAVGADQAEGGITTRLSVLEPEPRLAYSATVRFGQVTPAAEPATLPNGVGASPIDAQTAYRRWLFHGPSLQTITAISGLDTARVIATVRPTRPSDFYPPAGESWLFDPGVLDAAMQLGLIWARAMRNETPLPTRMGRVTRFGAGPLDSELTIAMQFKTRPDESYTLGDFDVIDRNGLVRLHVAELEAMSSAALNRLGAGWAGGEIDEAHP